MRILFIAVVSSLLFSCYTSKKADKDLNKVQKHYPEKIAKFARDSFPCTTTDIITDTVFDIIEVMVDCPETETVVITETINGKKDTVVRTKYIKVPVEAPVQIITKTERVEDSAKIMLMRIEKAASDKRTEEIQKESDGKTASIVTWRTIALIFLGAAILFALLFFKKRR